MGDADTKDADALYEFGLNLGMAFQLQDDLLDSFGDEAIFGKKIGGDILCNKKTFLLIKAQELAKGDTKNELEKWICLEVYVPFEVKITLHFLKIMSIGELIGELIHVWSGANCNIFITKRYFKKDFFRSMCSFRVENYSSI